MSAAVQTKRPKCPECGSKQVLYRSRTNTQRCRLCGALWTVQAQQPAQVRVQVTPSPAPNEPGGIVEGDWREVAESDAKPEPASRDATDAQRTDDEKIEVAFDEKGLVAAIAQDDRTGEVLMLAYMDRESLRRTLESGQAWFYSRSRQELWHKGATSGHFLNVRGVSLDCDGDAILLKVDPEGPACHTGNRTCFFTALTEGDVH